MTEVHWQRLQELFAEARARPATERAAFLDAACGSDVSLRHEVLGLLAASAAPGPVERVAERWAAPLLRELRPPVLPGAVLGGYRLVREIGRGGMAVVYEAHDPRLQRSVALKLLLSADAPGPDGTSRLLAEARAASALDHPNICAIHHAGETEDGRVFLVMPLYGGEPLQRRLVRGPLPLADALSIGRQVARGLAAAHATGIVHRDIKPANLMITADGGVRILDFGIATLQRGQSGADRTPPVGTLAWMAPEQLRGAAVDARADLWALGVVLYEMLTAQRPFDGTDEAGIVEEILHWSPPRPSELRPGVPVALDHLVLRLLEKDPGGRIPDATAVDDALERVQAALGGGVSGAGALPLPLTELVGRAFELQHVPLLLERARLLTLTGAAGAGKTRLAVEIARRTAHRFADGCRFIDLAAVRRADGVVPAITHALGLAELPGIPALERLAHVVKDQSLLLVIDNFEHVLGAARDVRALLGACPALRVLVTSRTPLQVEGEQEVPVSPLPVPGPAGGADPDAVLAWDAVRLFVERARAVRPDFRLTQENAASVAALCTRLDGLPLAIELAAARTRLFPPESLLRRLGERIDLLRHEHGDRPDRHQTLYQAIAWSHDLLDAETRRAFRRLAVFRGGFTLEAMEAVCADGPDAERALEGLVNHSLVQRRGAAEPRFQLLETVRVFAGEQPRETGEDSIVRQRHAAYMTGLAEQLEPSLTGAAQAAGFDRLDVEHDNLRAALAWSERNEPALGMRLAAALWRFWVARGYLQEAREWLERLSAHRDATVAPALRARLLGGAATVAQNQGDNHQARAWLGEALALYREADDRHGVAAALNHLSWVACETTRLAEAAALAEEALALCQRLGDRRGEALAQNNLGWVAAYRDDGPLARERHAAGLAIRRAIGDQRGVAYALTNLAWAERLCSEFQCALELLDEADRVLVLVRDPVLWVWSRLNRGMVERDRGRDADAVRCLEEALHRWPEAGNRSLRATALTELGEIRMRTAEPAAAESMLRDALCEWRAIDCSWGLKRAASLLDRIAASGGAAPLDGIPG